MPRFDSSDFRFSFINDKWLTFKDEVLDGVIIFVLLKVPDWELYLILIFLGTFIGAWLLIYSSAYSFHKLISSNSFFKASI